MTTAKRTCIIAVIANMVTNIHAAPVPSANVLGKGEPGVNIRYYPLPYYVMDNNNNEVRDDGLRSPLEHHLRPPSALQESAEKLCVMAPCCDWKAQARDIGGGPYGDVELLDSVKDESWNSKCSLNWGSDH